MPPDKQNGKPFTPTLSSNFRSTKSPLTPRLAGATVKSPATVKREPFVRQPSPNKEDASPLSLNITPRTAARRSRIGTESPSTTPTTARATAGARSALAGSTGKSTPSSQGLGILSPPVSVSTPLSEISNPVKSPTPTYTVPRRVSNARSTVRPDEGDDSKFFRADNAKSYHSQSQDTPATEPDTHFFFVGSQSETTLVSPKLLPSKTVQTPIEDKFFHASDARQRPSARPIVQARSTPGSVVARGSPQLGSKLVRPITRSRSPAKGPQLGRPMSRGKDGQPSFQANVTPNADKRRGSMGSNVSAARDAQLSHRKSMSANSVASTPTRKLSVPRPLAIPTLEQRLGLSTSSVDSLLIPSASPDHTSPRSTSLGSGPSEIAPLGDPVFEVPVHPNSGQAASPTDPITSPSLAPTNKPNDPAAQARRERKVLDLEISNSSLLAINKTLERELRKQNVELRRFRRLSRSGRLSFAPTARNVSNSTLGTLPELGDESEHSQSDSEPDDDDFDDDDLDIMSNESSSGITSPSVKARQRARDEQRLILDLTKHQQMLVDSQKLSQSIKRCLTCTDDLIREGTKALDYRVGIGDVQIGGRVLNNDEDDHHDSGSQDEGRKGLLSPGVELGNWLEGGLWVAQRPSSAQSVSVDELEALVDGQTEDNLEAAMQLVESPSPIEDVPPPPP